MQVDLTKSLTFVDDFQSPIRDPLKTHDSLEDSWVMANDKAIECFEKNSYLSTNKLLSSLSGSWLMVDDKAQQNLTDSWNGTGSWQLIDETQTSKQPEVAQPAVAPEAPVLTASWNVVGEETKEAPQQPAVAPEAPVLTDSWQVVGEVKPEIKQPESKVTMQVTNLTDLIQEHYDPNYVDGRLAPVKRQIQAFLSPAATKGGPKAEATSVPLFCTYEQVQGFVAQGFALLGKGVQKLGGEQAAGKVAQMGECVGGWINGAHVFEKRVGEGFKTAYEQTMEEAYPAPAPMRNRNFDDLLNEKVVQPAQTAAKVAKPVLPVLAFLGGWLPGGSALALAYYFAPTSRKTDDVVFAAAAGAATGSPSIGLSTYFSLRRLPDALRGTCFVAGKVWQFSKSRLPTMLVSTVETMGSVVDTVAPVVQKGFQFGKLSGTVVWRAFANIAGGYKQAARDAENDAIISEFDMVEKQEGVAPATPWKQTWLQAGVHNAKPHVTKAAKATKEATVHVATEGAKVAGVGLAGYVSVPVGLMAAVLGKDTVQQAKERMADLAGAVVARVSGIGGLVVGEVLKYETVRGILGSGVSSSFAWGWSVLKAKVSPAAQPKA